VAIIEMKSN